MSEALGSIPGGTSFSQFSSLFPTPFFHTSCVFFTTVYVQFHCYHSFHCYGDSTVAMVSLLPLRRVMNYTYMYMCKYTELVPPT